MSGRALTNLSFALLGISLLVMMGTNGSGCDGGIIPEPPPTPDEQSAVMGQSGYDDTATTPGMVVTIREVRGTEGGRVLPGGELSATFTLANRNGMPIDISELDRFSIHVSGPTTHYQRVIAAKSDKDRATLNDDGSYTYMFADPFPSAYIAPLNDSDAFGSADGEWTGQAIQPGTYTLGIEARRDFDIDGETIRDSGDCYFNFLVGESATSAMPEVVKEVNCEKCHNQLTVHGNNRFSVKGCSTCHTAGAEDRTSSDPAKATTGATIAFGPMIHAIHRGADLPTVKATANGSDPFHYELVGFGESVIDYSKVQFPVMPGGTGFNLQTLNCWACHEGTTDESNYYLKPSRAACSSCHNDINWTDGTHLDRANSSVSAGTLTKAQLTDAAFRKQIGGIPHDFGDTECMLCHAEGTLLSVRTVHEPVLKDPALINGLKVVVILVNGDGGRGYFLPGDILEVTFNLLDGNNNAVNIADVASVNFVFSGPIGNYQKVLPTSGNAVSLKGAGGVPSTGTGPFKYTSPTPLPATYPTITNDSADYVYADGWGEFAGLPLKEGTYSAMVYASRNIVVESVTYRETSPPGVFDVRLGTAGAVTHYPDTVTDAKCNSCHGQDIRFHGNGRRGVKNCIMCHVGGAEDRPTPAAGQTQDPAPDLIDFRVMIHKIHNARELNVVQNGGKYDLIGNGNNVVDFSHADLPAMPAGAKHCTMCHANDNWQTPTERSDVAVWKIACTSCHDAASTATHVQINTINGLQEACATCHGPGREFSVEKSHRIP